MGILRPALLLHIGGAGTFTAAFVVALIFVGLFTFSFAFGRPPPGGRRLSRAWAAGWLKASLPRLAVAAGFSGLLFVTSAQFGSGGSQDTPTVCSAPLIPVRPGPVGQADFDAALTGMEAVFARAKEDDVAGTREAFFLRVHDFTHNVDGPLRAQDEAMAKSLCDAVLQFETDLLLPTPQGDIAQQAEKIRDLMQEAAAEMGFQQ